jgi:hypothetical protein
MAGQYSPLMAPTRKPLKHARCACCGHLKDRDPTPWRPGDPYRPCPTCAAAGCAHKWQTEWTRGHDCPARVRGRKARTSLGSARGRPPKRKEAL